MTRGNFAWMADHDRRRKAMRRQRSRAREGVHANQEMGSQINSGREVVEEIDEDLSDILYDLCQNHHGLTARAA